MIKRFFKDSILYSLANLLTRGIGFALLPVYTRVLSKEEYGLFDYLTTIGTFLGVIVTLEISQAVFRLFPDHSNHPKQQQLIASTGFWFTLFMYILLAIFCQPYTGELAELLLDNANRAPLITIASILFLANALLYNSTVLLRANLMSRQVVLISTINAILIAVISLTLVAVYDLGMYGLLTGQLIGVSITILITSYWTKKWIRLAFNLKLLKEMLSFSAPLVLSSIGVVLSMFVDRIMLKEFMGAEQLASYSVAIKIASIVSFIMIGFQSALTPLIYANYKKKETPSEIAKLFHIYLFAALAAIVFFSFTAEWTIHIVVGDQYMDSFYFVVPLATASLISSMYLFFPGLSIEKKTGMIASISIIIGLLNVLLNYFLIPIFGGAGAAYSTLLASSIALFLNVILSQYFYTIPIRKDFVFYTFFSIALSLLLFHLHHNELALTRIFEN